MDYIKLLCVRLKVENGLGFIFIDVCLKSNQSVERKLRSEKKVKPSTALA